MDVNESMMKHSSLAGFHPSIRINEIWMDQRDHLWIATNGEGVIIYNGKRHTLLNTEKGLSSNVVWDFEEDKDGRVWIATNQGVSIYDGRNFSYLSKDKGNFGAAAVRSLMRDSKDRMWVGTTGGGFSIHENNEAVHYMEIEGNDDIQITDIYEAKDGRVWLGTYGFGAIEYNDGKITSHPFEKGSSDSYITSIESSLNESSDAIWFGSYGGLLKFEGGTWSKEWDEKVSAILLDGEQLWMGTTEGFVKWNEQAPSEIILPTAMLEEGSVRCISSDRWGNIWIGHRKLKLTQYPTKGNYKKQRDIENLTSVPVITEIEVNQKKINWVELEGADFQFMEKWCGYPENPALDHELNELLFRFNGVTYRENDKVFYSWRLMGLNEEWSTWSEKDHVLYSDLPTGKFTFELKCKNLNENISETVSFRFEIRKAYWDTWVFRISVVLGVLFFIFQIYRWRKNSFSNHLD